MVACVSFSLQASFFVFFYKIKFLSMASYETLDDPCEGRRPCLA